MLMYIGLVGKQIHFQVESLVKMGTRFCTNYLALSRLSDVHPDSQIVCFAELLFGANWI